MDPHAGFARPPVLAHFGHAFGIPEGPARAERLATIGMDRLVLGDAGLRHGIDHRLGRDLLAPQGQRLRQGDAGFFLDLGHSFRIEPAGRPAGQIPDHVALDHAGRRSSPIFGDQGQHRLQLIEQIMSFLGAHVRAEQKMLRLVFGRTADSRRSRQGRDVRRMGRHRPRGFRTGWPGPFADGLGNGRPCPDG